jgi:hypothetical protein
MVYALLLIPIAGPVCCRAIPSERCKEGWASVELCTGVCGCVIFLKEDNITMLVMTRVIKIDVITSAFKGNDLSEATTRYTQRITKDGTL